MSIAASLTLRGLTSYDPNLFDNLVLPVPPTADSLGVLPSQIRAAWTIDRDTFIEYLCFTTMSMSLMVPDAEFMKHQIGVWSATHLPEWQRMFDTMFYRYNPLWNKDATTDETEAITKGRTEHGTNANVSNANSTITDFVHGYDQPAQQAQADNLEWTHSNKRTGSSSGRNDGTNDFNMSGNESGHKITTEKGNIGVTMVQDMITKERELALYNVEEYIAQDFKRNFCIMVW